jgi:hypothetical protein
MFRRLIAPIRRYLVSKELQKAAKRLQSSNDTILALALRRDIDSDLVEKYLGKAYISKCIGLHVPVTMKFASEVTDTVIKSLSKEFSKWLIEQHDSLGLPVIKLKRPDGDEDVTAIVFTNEELKTALLSALMLRYLSGT